MALYIYQCEKCGNKIEVLNGRVPLCCSEAMSKRPTAHVMVKWKGEGGFPSMRRAYKGGTAPYTRGYGDVPAD